MLTYWANFEYNRNGTSNASRRLLTACRGLCPLTPDEPFGSCGPLTTQNVPPYGREPLLATLAQSTATFPQNHYERDDGNALLHFRYPH